MTRHSLSTCTTNWPSPKARTSKRKCTSSRSFPAAPPPTLRAARAKRLDSVRQTRPRSPNCNRSRMKRPASFSAPPGLGRRLPAGVNIRTVAAGQRLYHLAIPNRRPLTARGPRGRNRVRRLARVYVTLDHTKDQVRVCVFLSEVKAQRLAVKLRQQSHAGSLTVGFHKLLGRRLPPILHGKRRRRLRIVHTAVPPGAASQAHLAKLATIVPQAFIAKLQEWLVPAFAEFIKTQSQKFLSAAEDPADGVTLDFTIDQPAGLKELGQALAGKEASSAVAESVTKGGRPTVRVEALSGHKCV